MLKNSKTKISKFWRILALISNGNFPNSENIFFFQKFVKTFVLYRTFIRYKIWTWNDKYLGRKDHFQTW